MIFLYVLGLGSLIGYLASHYVKDAVNSVDYYHPEEMPFGVSLSQAISNQITDAPITIALSLLAIIVLQCGIIYIMNGSKVRIALFEFNPFKTR